MASPGGLGPVLGAAVVAVLCAGAAGWLAVGGRDVTGRRARELLAGDGGVLDPVAWRVRWRRAGRWGRGRIGREAWCLPVGLAVGLADGSVVPVLASVAAAVAVRRWLAAREAERERERRTAGVIGLCAAVAGELRAGQQPHRALLATGAPGLGQEGAAVLAAARYGGDVPRALRTAARLPGADGLTGMAACWQVAVQGGAGLASGLERIAAALRTRHDQRGELRAQLAGPRATALMLALLPVCGLLMGSALGADPLRVLLHTPAGWGCLVVGGLLEWGGVAWTARIVAHAGEERGKR
ncbi:type II secretion system F family protein [Streptomyces sp. NPDC048483]|uniref:type II secretion system F family protein n=1 Tax=Streptomyces sp. NPDC048483 TaxID=3154927 RepID=UPI00341B1A8E